MKRYRDSKVIPFAERRRAILETRSPAHWEGVAASEQRDLLGMVAGARPLGGAGDSGFEVKSIGPTEADRTFFQSIRLKLANNPLSRPFAQHPIVYAAVHAIAGSVCDTNLDVVESDKETGAPVDNAISACLNDPNPLMSVSEFLYMIVVYLSTSGECMLVKEGANGRVRSVSEVPVELWPLNGRLFQHEIDPETKLVKRWILRPNTPDQVSYRPHEVVHIRYPNPYDPYRGLAPLEAASQAVMTDWSALLYNEAFFKNGGDPGGVISVPKPLSDKQREEIEDKFESRNVGVAKAKRVMVLGMGAKYDSFAQSHRDMEFTQLREFARWEILSALRVPPAEAGFYEDVNNATAKEESKRYWTRTVFPIFSLIEDALWSGGLRWIAGGKYCARFDRDAIPEMKEAVGDQVDTADKLVKMGWTAEQASKKVGLDMPINPWQRHATVSPTQLDAAAWTRGVESAAEGESDPTPPKESFNGAQVTSAQNILLAVAGGTLGAEAGYQMLLQFFPGINPDSARKMIDSAKPSAAPALPQGAAPASPAAPVPPKAPAPTPTPPSAQKLPENAPAAAPDDRGFSRRRAYWKSLQETHYGPEEGKFRGMLRRYFMALRAEQLRKVAGGLKAFHSGAPQLFSLAEVGEIRAWSSELAALGYVPGETNELSVAMKHIALHERAPKSIDRVLFDSKVWKEKLAEASRPHYSRVVQASQKRLAKEIGWATEWNSSSKAVKRLTDTFASKVTGVTDTVRRNLREQIADAVADGGGVREVQAAVKNVFKVSLSRSLTIARTEVGSVSNRASFIAMGAAGVQEIEWVSAGDDKVRDEHQIDGETTEVGKAFSNGLRFPHDPDGDAGEVINCRCDMAPVVDDDFEPEDAEDFDVEDVEIEEG